ncbi:hypothetical protein [Larkinella rosea]|uniref:Uncharacterized protein n=1 Tax=Larkinella rosea TaxID=2025312 RepID=A0A3P1BMR0_9BACT|nr:hypothetical protein [Larkinella rosea]RRB02318.1 hypothetical protein EHT25_17765 [Larkinella rosea]
MKNILTSLTVTVFLLLTNCCQNPLENVSIGFKDPIEKGIVEVRFRSLKGTIPKSVKLTLAGPDADAVVTTLNTTHFKINEDGVLILAASPESDYSNTNPLNFFIVAQAPDYLDIIQPVQLTDTSRHTVSPAWLKLTDPPFHVSATQLTGVKPAAGLIAVTPVINQKKDNMTAVIAPGSELTDATGTALAGPFTAALTHIENRSNSPASFLPTGSVMAAVAGLDGKDLGSQQFSQIAGVFSLELYDDQFRMAQEVSRPVLCTMTLNPELINPTVGRSIQASDAIPFWRYNRFTGRWHQENPVAVTRNASTNQLECKISIAHPELWVAGWTQAVCDEGPVFRVSSKFNQVDIRYLCKVVDADTKQELSSFYTFLNNGERITLTHLRQNQKVQLRIYNYNDAYSTGDPGQPLFETAPLVSCNPTPQTLDLQKLAVPPAITVSFDFVCPPPTKLNESLLPARIRLQYSVEGKREWHDLVTLERKNPNAMSYKLQLKKPYAIRVSTDGGATWPLEQTHFVPDNNRLAFEIASPEFCK